MFNKINASKKAVVIYVNVGEDKSIVEKYIKDNDLNMNVVLDKNRKIANAFGISTFPTTVFINKKCKVIGIVPTALDENALSTIVKDIESGSINTKKIKNP